MQFRKQVPARKHNSRAQRPGLLENLFVFMVLLFSTGALTDFWLAKNDVDTNAGEGSIATQLAWAGIYILVIVLLVMRRDTKFKRIILANKSLVLLVVLALASVMWSQMPSLTLRRGIGLVGTCIFGTYFGLRYSVVQQLKILAWLAAAVILMSLATATLFPAFGVMTGFSEGAWRGVFVTKNEFGRAMVLSSTVFFLLFRHSSQKLVYLIGGVVSLLMAVLSSSAAAVAIGIALALLIFGYGFLRKVVSRPATMVGAAVVVLIIGIWTANNFDTILYGIGKDPNLTGRTLLWGAVLVSIRNRPLLGAGYNGFWAGGGGALIRSIVGWEAPHAHNGYLDLCLDLGVTGLVLYLVSLAVNFRRASKFAKWSNGSAGLWPFVYMSFMLLYNVTESGILARNTLFWILYISTTVVVTAGQPVRQVSRLRRRVPIRPANVGLHGPLSAET